MGNEIESENQLHLPNSNWKWVSTNYNRLWQIFSCIRRKNCDSSCEELSNIDPVQLPQSSDWIVDKTDACDGEGWQYAGNFHSPFSASSGRGARKRKKLRSVHDMFISQSKETLSKSNSNRNIVECA